LYVSEVLKVLYAPRKALKEVIQNPRYVGTLFVLVLFVAANVGSQYFISSKSYTERILPNGTLLDEWTENATLWTSNVVPVPSGDFINGTHYGNQSLEFSVTNASQVWMQLNDIGNINCSAAGDYNVSSFRVKWTSPIDNPPVNMTVQMLSAGTSDYFYSTFMGDSFNVTYDVWNNLTIPLGPLATPEWSNSGPSADWGNITGLKLEFIWPTSSNITLRLDSIIFHGVFRSFLESEGMGYLLSDGLFYVMQFAFMWIVFGGLVYLLIKLLSGKPVWRTVLVVVAFVLMIMFVQALVNAVAYATLPNLYYPLDYLGGVQGEGVAAVNTLASQTWLVSEVTTAMQIITLIWTIGLAAIAVRLLAEFSWIKSGLVAMVAYLVTLIIIGFIFG
jgi:hypothetical protein